MSDIGILVVNYNNLGYTKDCVNDLFQQINQNFDLYVIDQNSTEKGTMEFLDEIENFITIIRNPTNLDLNRVWNYFFNNCPSKYLCFLNNDVRLTNNFTDDIIKIFEKEKDVGVVIHATNNLQFIKEEHTLSYEILNPPLYQGWDFCLRREAYTKIPDNLRIFGGDDFLFSHLVKKGYKVALSNSSPIIHYKGRTRVKMGKTIHDIQNMDGNNYRNQIKIDGLQYITSTMLTNKCNQYAPEGMKLIQNTNCIFTTIIGNYDGLPKLVVKKEENWDYICFTDNINLKSDVWKIIYINNEGKTQLENSKLSRYYKTNFHKFLLGYYNIIYMDARMEIVGNINQQLNILSDFDIILMKHPDANSIKEEMKRVLSGRLESVKMVNTVKKRYEEAGYKYDNGLYAGGILLFKNNKNTIKFFNEWWYEIENFSHRDQLSLNYVINKNPELKVGLVKFNEIISKYFRQTPRISKRITF